jgi:DNA-binding winged helix-turn-helix (wHTH) protein/TolB-like protein/tetratricopeptide (TPR) repeat protein
VAGVYLFGDFRLQIDERRLFRGDELVQLEPKAFDLLACLVAHAGQLVDKQKLVDEVWGRAAVTDNSITRCIHQVRAGLGDQADTPAFIETVTGSGYRFIAPVEVSGPSTDGTTTFTVRRAASIGIGVLVLLALGLILYLPGRDQRVDRIAVLPLANLTGNPDQAYVADGIHDALINQLGRLASVDVLSRTTTVAYRDSALTLPEIAHALDVDAILEGSVGLSGDDITVAVQLMRAEPERQLWAGSFTQDTDHTYAIGRDVARTIATELGVPRNRIAVTFPESGRAIDPDAYDAYLKGRYDLEQRNAGGLERARTYFRRAVEIDPDFALPYVGLANVLGSAATFGVISPAEAYPEAKRLAEHAIELDPDLAYAHTALAGVELYWNWNWPAAERGLRRAMTLNPNLPNPHRMISEVLSLTGRHDEALAAVERGRALDPLAAISRFKPILVLYLGGDYAGAIGRAVVELESQPEFWQGHWLLCLSHAALEQYANAIADCARAVEFSSRIPMALGTLGYAYAQTGQFRQAREVLAELKARSSDEYVPPATRAIIHGALGENDRAFELLETGYRERDQLLIHIDHYRFFDPLRTDPRFEALRNRIIRKS